jgi:hypothetical protein
MERMGSWKEWGQVLLFAYHPQSESGKQKEWGQVLFFDYLKKLKSKNKT